jgi:methylmalonyl-CoA mutase
MSMIREVMRSKLIKGLIWPLAPSWMGSPVEHLTELAKSLLIFSEAFHHAGGNLFAFFRALRIEYSPSADLLFELAMFRATMILLYNIQSHFDLEVQPVKMVARIELDRMADEDNNKLILATSSLLASMVSEADQLLIHSDKIVNAQGQSLLRLTGNIAHLLKEEAAIGYVSDALAGSYAIEDLTSQLATTAWNKLKQATQDL